MVVVMKTNLTIYPLFIACLLFGFWDKTLGKSSTGNQTNQHAQIFPQLIIQEIIEQVSLDRMLSDLGCFTGVEPICTSNGCTTITDRFTGSQNLKWVEDYVYENLVHLKYSMEVQDWVDGELSDQNILAHKRGFLYPNEEIYFIAHMDGYPRGGQAADDDGTGAVALLELARVLATRTFTKSITLFFSTGEEQGAIGARQFVKNYPDRLKNIKYLVSVEMLGYDSNHDMKMELWSADQYTDFLQVLNNIITTYPDSITLDPIIITGCT
jgi:hypothetical protein